MRYTVYRTTNLATAKIYIGVHKTLDPNDAYLGSGSTMLSAIAKYGRSQFSKEILFDFETSEEAYAKEAELVTEDFVARDDNYNIKLGGGSLSRHSKATRAKMSKAKLGNKNSLGHRHSVESKKLMSQVKIGNTFASGNLGNKRSKATKDAISRANSKSTIVKGLQFKSRTEAAKHFNVSPTTIGRWLKA